jgi:biopolymer transport protein ExbD
MKLERRTETRSGIPTSTMADIAFLLIVFFMVTSVFSATKGLEFRLPSDDDNDDDPEPVEAVFIHVQRDRVTVDCRTTGLHEILPYLEPKLLRDPNKPVILYTDPDAEYRRMVSVYDLLAGTRSDDSPWAFEVRNVSVPTRRDVAQYVALFGVDPFATRCPD